MKIGLISDTHEHLQNTKSAIHIFNEQHVDMIIHLGDYCAGPTVRTLETAKAEIVGIMGNNDGDVGRLQYNLANVGGRLITEEFAALELDNLKVACYHGTVAEITEALIGCQRYDVVFYGHTHESDIRTVKSTYVCNPGSAHGFDSKASIAVFDTATKQAELIEL